jgi:hypothetical protein
LAAEEIEQDGHTLARGQDASDNGFQIMESAAGNDDFFAGPQFLVENVDFIGADRRAEIGDDVVGDLRELFAEMDNAANAAGAMNAASGGHEIEASEEVAGEKSLGKPNRTAAGGALETDARKIDFDSGFLGQMGGGDVFVLGLRTEAIPGAGGGRWEMGDGRWQRREGARTLRKLHELQSYIVT